MERLSSSYSITKLISDIHGSRHFMSTVVMLCLYELETGYSRQQNAKMEGEHQDPILDELTCFLTLLLG